MKSESHTILRFLIELRRRLIYCIGAWAIIFLSLIYFANDLYTLLAQPLLKYLPTNHGLIATNIIAPFFVPFQLTAILSLFFAIPVLLYQLWGFIAPALYQNEKRLVWPLLMMSTFLFYLGVSFAYFVIFPLLFKFLIHTAPQGVVVSPDISQYLDFTLQLFFIFGGIFEVPIVTVLLIWTGITTRVQLIKMRPYIIVGAFIFAMLVGPPDVWSQTLLAVPIWLLFELGLLVARFFPRSKLPEEKSD